MKLPKRKLHRLKDYDYSQDGYYFITICTKDRRNLLAAIMENTVPDVSNSNDQNKSNPTVVGNVVPDVPNPIDQNMQNKIVKCPYIIPTAIGESVISAWNKISEIEENIKTDYFCLMPNHIHGTIIINNQPQDVPISERRGRRSLQDIVRGFKSVTTRLYNDSNKEKSQLWQTSFYDEIIKSEEHYNKTCKYIFENPMRIIDDEYYSQL